MCAVGPVCARGLGDLAFARISSWTSPDGIDTSQYTVSGSFDLRQAFERRVLWYLGTPGGFDAMANVVECVRCEGRTQK